MSVCTWILKAFARSLIGALVGLAVTLGAMLLIGWYLLSNLQAGG